MKYLIVLPLAFLLLCTNCYKPIKTPPDFVTVSGDKAILKDIEIKVMLYKTGRDSPPSYDDAVLVYKDSLRPIDFGDLKHVIRYDYRLSYKDSIFTSTAFDNFLSLRTLEKSKHYWYIFSADNKIYAGFGPGKPVTNPSPESSYQFKKLD